MIAITCLALYMLAQSFSVLSRLPLGKCQEGVPAYRCLRCGAHMPAHAPMPAGPPAGAYPGAYPPR